MCRSVQGAAQWLAERQHHWPITARHTGTELSVIGGVKYSRLTKEMHIRTLQNKSLQAKMKLCDNVQLWIHFVSLNGNIQLRSTSFWNTVYRQYFNRMYPKCNVITFDYFVVCILLERKKQDVNFNTILFRACICVFQILETHY